MAASFSRLWALALTAAALSVLVTAVAASSPDIKTMNWLASSSTGSGSCPAAKKTLSSSCGGLCGDNEACLAYDAATVDNSSCSDCVTDADDLCTYQCFDLNYEDPDGTFFYYFLVSYGAYESDAEKSERTTNPNFDDEVDALENDTSFIAHISNDLVTTIGTLDVPVETTSVYICGGTTCMESVRGKMALVNFTSNLVANEIQATLTMIGNINMAGQVDNVPSLVPKSTTYLLLSNVMILEFPTSFGSMTNLLVLWLDYNYIKVVDSTGGLDRLRTLNLQFNLLDTFDVTFTELERLNLSHNALETIPSTSLTLDRLLSLDLGDNLLTELEGSMPSLVYLNLSGNAFTEIPPIVFNLTELQTFYFAGNPLASFSFTWAQVEFLKGLNNTDIAKWTATSKLNCLSEDQTEVNRVKVCVTDVRPAPGPIHPNHNLVLIICITAGVVLLVVIGVVWCCIRRRRNAQKNSAQAEGDNCQYYINNDDNNYPTAYSSEPQVSQYRRPSSQPTNSNPRYPDSNRHPARGSSSVSASGSSFAQEHHSSQALWNDPDLLSLQLRNEDIRDIRVLGTGAYGVVWLVQFRESELLASKRLKREMVTRARTQEFITEIKLVAGFNHPNIVQFVGAAWHNDMDLQALFEFMENGDLRSFLLRPDVPHRWTLEKLQLAIDMVEALVYVHSFSPPLVHRDLKSRNVLVSGEVRAKLTDFGVSRFQSNDSTMTMGVGTSRWLAPEIISGTTDYNQSADVFSVGVVLSELDTHELPYDDAVGPTGNKLEDIAILQRVANGALRPSFSARCPSRIVEIAHLCMAQEQADRPSAAEVAYVLRTFQRQLLQEQHQQ